MVETWLSGRRLRVWPAGDWKTLSVNQASNVPFFKSGKAYAEKDEGCAPPFAVYSSYSGPLTPH